MIGRLIISCITLQCPYTYVQPNYILVGGEYQIWSPLYYYVCNVNSRVPKTVRHRTSFHIICPKLLIDSSPSQLESIYSSPTRLKSQASIRRPTLKLFGSSPSRLKSPASVCRLLLKLFGSSPSCPSFDRGKNFWLTSELSVPRPLQPLTTHILNVFHPPLTETKMSPIVCTDQN